MKVVYSGPKAMYTVYSDTDFRGDPCSEYGLWVTAGLSVLSVIGETMEIDIPFKLLCMGGHA